ncbi:hypothetical protein ASD38_01610 [Caulobacter sp. Root487D2Y]|uniref:hypothetical protein n=1 Tax=Caulobacter sp. Root487D2Y TaxID=1736547 RepID=UPI0006F69F8A|nr:hypothetical protein [Caulobacter sp. Root487D2Y]KQY35291.1 hypothetical protein ASD38_01610 [Caulobacter sp. Root487D2Y]
MNAADLAVDICIASAEEALRFSGFVQAFLSRNGFPFVMIHNAPDLSGERRKVVFEDAVVGRKFATEWRRDRLAACSA